MSVGEGTAEERMTSYVRRVVAEMRATPTGMGRWYVSCDTADEAECWAAEFRRQTESTSWAALRSERLVITVRPGPYSIGQPTHSYVTGTTAQQYLYPQEVAVNVRIPVGPLIPFGQRLRSRFKRQ